MKKVLAILAIAMLISGAAYATTDTAPNLDSPLSAHADLTIEVLDSFYLIVTPDDVDLDIEDGLVESGYIYVTAGSGGSTAWHINAIVSTFAKNDDPNVTFNPSDPGVLSLAIYPALDQEEDEMGVSYFEQEDQLPVPIALTKAYVPLDGKYNAVHACAARIVGNMPVATTGTYEGTLTFEMKTGLPAA